MRSRSLLPPVKYSTHCRNFVSAASYSCSSSSFKVSCCNSFSSPSSATRKPGSSPISWKWFLITKRQKLSMVVICALCSNAACRCRCSLNGSFESSRSIACRIRSRICAAAAFVKVTTSSLSISTGCSLFRIICMIRSTSTAVLPEPAAAETSRFRFLVSITCCCSFVKVTPTTFSPFRICSHLAPDHCL